ncbi:MAG TPA: aspartate/glutamate racemase family protein [Thermoanaerobaculia bacterium]|nr:aspartate/glutamate racemase family protein [Thermoanaerobaculia bacterium]
MGPRSTGPFIDLVVSQCQEIYGARHDIDFPKMLICSQPAPFYEDRPVDHVALEAAVREGLLHLQSAGADFLAIACNTAHIYYESLAATVDVPLLSIVESTVRAIPRQAGALALLAARPTVEAGIFQDALRGAGHDLREIDWRDQVDALLAATRESTAPASFQRFWDSLFEQARAAGVDTVVVACLDLSGILRYAVTDLALVDAANCLARSIVEEWVARRDARS